jgi:hypothetical protein
MTKLKLELLTRFPNLYRVRNANVVTVQSHDAGVEGRAFHMLNRNVDQAMPRTTKNVSAVRPVERQSCIAKASLSGISKLRLAGDRYNEGRGDSQTSYPRPMEHEAA